MQEVLYKKYGKHPREALFFTVCFYILLFISREYKYSTKLTLFHLITNLKKYQHALPLPGFLLLFHDISNHIGIANLSEPLESAMLSAIPFINILPRIWVYLICNVLTQ